MVDNRNLKSINSTHIVLDIEAQPIIPYFIPSHLSV